MLKDGKPVLGRGRFTRIWFQLASSCTSHGCVRCATSLVCTKSVYSGSWYHLPAWRFYPLTESQPKANERLYSTPQYLIGVIAEIEAAFEEKCPRVDLQVYRAGTGDVIERVEEELAAGQVSADLLWMADFTVGDGKEV